MIHHQNKFIFVHIPKCGGHSIETVFGAWTAGKHEHYWVNQHRQHWKLPDILGKFPTCQEYFKFIFVRNPFSRLVSEYSYIKKQSKHDISDMTFKDFCLDLDKNLSKYCFDYHELTLMDYMADASFNYIGKFENLQKDFDTVCDKIGIPRQQLPHKNKSKHKHYTEYYDEETKQIVASYYAEDIKRFDYKFEQ